MIAAAGRGETREAFITLEGLNDFGVCAERAPPGADCMIPPPIGFETGDVRGFEKIAFFGDVIPRGDGDTTETFGGDMTLDDFITGEDRPVIFFGVEVFKGVETPRTRPKTTASGNDRS